MKWDGKPIAVKGAYTHLPLETYHLSCCTGPSASSSGLRTIFMRSPAHYWVTSPLNPDCIERSDTEAFTLGRGSHHLLLGEDDFSTLFVQRPEVLDGEAWHGNRKACRAWMQKQRDAGRTVLKPEQIEAMRGMAKALSAHPLVRAGILNGDIEQSLIWQDKATGVWLKARPDAVPNDSGDFADLKTSSYFGDELDREVSKHRYDIQAALTKWAAREVLGIAMASFSFVFVGSEPPHCVDVLTLDATDIEAAEQDLRCAVDTFAWCLKHNNWFGPSGTQMDARYVRISEWARERAEYKRDFLKREIEKTEAIDRRYSAEEYAGA